MHSDDDYTDSREDDADVGEVGQFASADDLLKEAAARPPDDSLKMTIREFIGYWDARRRGSWTVERIHAALEEHGLVTVPPFENGWIDNMVALKPLRRSGRQAVLDVDEAATSLTDPLQIAAVASSSTAQRFSDLPSADCGLVSVKPQADIREAQSLMMANDFSQLAVLVGERDLRGAVSWESISRARMHRPTASLLDVTVPATLVDLDDELLPHVPDIIAKGFVFVRRQDKSVRGIVTTTDLSAAFANLAGPFLLVGDVERRLRRVIRTTFDLAELQAVQHGDRGRVIESVEHMTAGEYVALLDHPERWQRLGWDVDRKVFITSLQAYRELRNEIMHFSPDPLEDGKLALVSNLLKWLRAAQPDASA